MDGTCGVSTLSDRWVFGWLSFVFVPSLPYCHWHCLQNHVTCLRLRSGRVSAHCCIIFSLFRKDKCWNAPSSTVFDWEPPPRYLWLVFAFLLNTDLLSLERGSRMLFQLLLPQTHRLGMKNTRFGSLFTYIHWVVWMALCSVISEALFTFQREEACRIRPSKKQFP